MPSGGAPLAIPGSEGHPRAGCFPVGERTPAGTFRFSTVTADPMTHNRHHNHPVRSGLYPNKPIRARFLPHHTLRSPRLLPFPPRLSRRALNEESSAATSTAYADRQVQSPCGPRLVLCSPHLPLPGLQARWPTMPTPPSLESSPLVKDTQT